MALLLGLAAGGLAPVAPPAQAADGRPVKCTIKVDGTVYEKGICDFTPQGGDGSFVLTGKDYFVYVSVTGKGVAEGSWNADPAATHAQTPLGRLKRKGACWKGGKGTRICAETLPKAEAEKITAARADGLMMYPDVPGASQACIQGERGIEAGSILALARCSGDEIRMFEVDGKGRLSVAGRPDLCLGLAINRRDPEDLPEITLETCGPDEITWRTQAGSGRSDLIRDGNGACFAIPMLETPEAPFPYPVLAAPCGGQVLRPVPVFLSKD